MTVRKEGPDFVADRADLPVFLNYHAAIEGRDIHFGQATSLTMAVVHTKIGQFINLEISAPEMGGAGLFMIMPAINARALAASLVAAADQADVQGSAVQ